MRKTKIIATIGPASRDPATLEELILAGMDCARLNFSHGTMEEHGEVIRMVRELSHKHRRHIAILQDLGGIKLRLGEVAALTHLNPGDEVVLAPQDHSQSQDILPFPHPDVIQNLRLGHEVFIADGTVRLEIIDEAGPVRAVVKNGGTVTSFKGVNFPGVPIDRPVLSEADKIALQFGVEQEVDWVAISFVRTAEDTRYVRSYLESIGSHAPVMAKLERVEGVDNIDAILQGVDGVMVARGDLGVEIPMERVPIVQKDVVKRANDAAKVSVIATQILYSMVFSPTPTRAEVSDIFNATMDGCDAVLLSDETAIGEYPVEAVKVADSAIREGETVYPYYKDHSSRDRTQAIAMAASQLTRSLRSKPLVITSTGRGAFEVSRFRPDNDIIAFSHDPSVLRRLALGWGLCPAGVVPPEPEAAALVASLIRGALESGLVAEDDVVTIVHGFTPGVSGTTNTIQVLDLKEYLSSASAPRTTEVRL